MSAKRKLAVGLSAAMVLAAAAVAGCGDDDKDTNSGDATQAPKIAYVTYLYADYQQAEEAGLKKVVGPVGGSVRVYNANFDPQKLTQQCTDAVTSGRFNVIVLTPSVGPTGVPCVKAAKAAGIPVIAMELAVGKDPDNVAPQVDGVVGSVVTPQSPGGDTVAELVKGACAGKDPCNLITDTIPGDTFGEITLAKVKAVPGVKIIQKINTNYDPAQMAKIAADTFTRNKNADVLMTLSDQQALAAVPAIKAAGLTGKIKLIGAGGSRQGAAAIADGTMYGTGATWPFQYGTTAGKMAIQAVNGDKVDPNAVDANKIDTPLVVTKDNVSQFKPEWGAAAN
ncbi:MAG TPA: sugar ABC transporter substrate-binding protein, partial [Baekduia sp.]|nr:sugar ABC transporter substrate-binding protein [Baekduia sp.]